MKSYQALKAEELKRILLGLDDRLSKCSCGTGDPVVVIQRMKDFVAGTAQEYLELEPAFADPDFGPDALNKLAQMVASLSVLEREYLPGLMHQTDEERLLRRCFLSCVKRLGMDWIEDMVVHASGTLATYQKFGNSLAIPVVHVHANFLEKCISQPGVFHEFGHSVFSQFPSLLQGMEREITTHFNEVRRQIGPVPETTREKFLERFNKAEEFWTERRLAELFCDFFGQYVGGVANIISMIDLSMAERQPACDTAISGYPPDAARLRVCEYTLSKEQSECPIVAGFLKEWANYANIEQAGQLYRDACPDKLLRRFSAVLLELLPKEMPTVPRNVSRLPELDEATSPCDSLTFEDAVERGMAILMRDAEAYDAWWSDARGKIA